MDYVSDSRKENMMYSESLVKLGKVRSEIREIFEYGNKPGKCDRREDRCRKCI